MSQDSDLSSSCFVVVVTQEIPLSKFIGLHNNEWILLGADYTSIVKLLKDKKVAQDVRLIIAPASKDVYLQAAKEGLLEIFIEAGANLIPAGCGPCVGVHGGILGDNEVCLATQNRNFQGRMGNTNGFIYLSSPYTAIKSAINGYIS